MATKTKAADLTQEVIDANQGKTRNRLPVTEGHACLCACKQGITTDALFRPGHDAKMVSQLVAELVNTIADGGKVTKRDIAASAKRLPSDALRAKFVKAATRAVTPKPAKQAATEAEVA